jgi:hypothetical protein
LSRTLATSLNTGTSFRHGTRHRMFDSMFEVQTVYSQLFRNKMMGLPRAMAHYCLSNRRICLVGIRRPWQGGGFDLRDGAGE